MQVKRSLIINSHIPESAPKSFGVGASKTISQLRTDKDKAKRNIWIDSIQTGVSALLIACGIYSFDTQNSSITVPTIIGTLATIYLYTSIRSLIRDSKEFRAAEDKISALHRKEKSSRSGGGVAISN